MEVTEGEKNSLDLWIFVLEGFFCEEAELFPFIEGKGITFKCPAPNVYEKYVEYIEQECPNDTPLAFGMDPNAEIDFRTG